MVTGLSSLYLLLCHIPITFMGFIKHPLFTWMPRFGQVLQGLYWPAFLLALFYLNTGPQKDRAQRLTKYFVGAQAAVGFAILVPALVFPETALPFFAWPLLFGPNLTGATGDMSSYVAALICLLPLLWMGFIRLASDAPAQAALPARPCGLPVFLSSAVFLGVLYTIQSAVLYHLSSSAFLKEAAASVVLHGIVFTAIFAVLRIGDRFAERTRNPWATWLAMRAVAAVALLYVVARKVLLYSIAFNNDLADLYSVLASVAVVVYVAPTVIARHRREAEASPADGLGPAFLARQALVLLAALGIYLLALRLVRFDWNQLIASLSTLAVWGLAFWFFAGFRRKPAPAYSARSLALLAAPTVLAIAGLVVLASGAASAAPAAIQEALDRYAGFDPSIYVMENVFRPTVNDSADTDYYRFLNRHANIEAPVAAPDITFVENFAAARAPRPNIFLFVIDALRRDYVSPYNPRVSFTPSIQRFADESVVFNDAMTLYGGSALAEPAIWSGVQEIHKHYPDPLSRMNALAKMLEADHYHAYIPYDFILLPLVPETRNVTPLRKGHKAWEESEFGAVLADLEQELLNRKDPERPVFAYSQPVNVHSLMIGNRKEAAKHAHPGFHTEYAFAVEHVDQEFGQFVQFLKDHGMYDNSVVILTADHGESLGDWGRWGHIGISPEILRIPLIIHVPERLKKEMVWDVKQPVFLEDITPSLYALAGHPPMEGHEMFGHSLFTRSAGEQTRPVPDHYLLMSSYMPMFGILSGDEKSLYVVDASLHRSYFYDLQHDPGASENRITAALKKKYEKLVREDLLKIDAFYRVDLAEHHN